MTATSGDARQGLWVAVGSFVLWGLMPLYWHLMKVVPSLQIVAHRVIWSTLLVVAWLLWTQGRGWLRAALARPRAAWMLALSGLLIGINWSLYVWAVNAGHVVESSLGYFINPLLNVLLGVVLLHERLSRAQWISVALAAAGVAWLTFQFGQPPWIAICLALSFALYGLLRKLLAIDAVAGLGVESVYLFVPALAVLLWAESHGQGGFFSAWGSGVDALLIFGGALTALPLIGFAFAVRRVRLSTVGLIQYIAPTLQLLTGVFVFHEAFDHKRLVGFAFIWAALAIFAGDGLWRARKRPVGAALAATPLYRASRPRPLPQLAAQRRQGPARFPLQYQFGDAERHQPAHPDETGAAAQVGYHVHGRDLVEQPADHERPRQHIAADHPVTMIVDTAVARDAPSHGRTNEPGNREHGQTKAGILDNGQVEGERPHDFAVQRGQ